MFPGLAKTWARVVYLLHVEIAFYHLVFLCANSIMSKEKKKSNRGGARPNSGPKTPNGKKVTLSIVFSADVAMYLRTVENRSHVVDEAVREKLLPASTCK